MGVTNVISSQINPGRVPARLSRLSCENVSPSLSNDDDDDDDSVIGDYKFCKFCLRHFLLLVRL